MTRPPWWKALMRVLKALLLISLLSGGASASVIDFSGRLLVPKRAFRGSYTLAELRLPGAGLHLHGVRVSLGNATEVSARKVVVELAKLRRVALEVEELKGALRGVPEVSGSAVLEGVVLRFSGKGVLISVRAARASIDGLGNFTASLISVVRGDGGLSVSLHSLVSQNATIRELLYTESGGSGKLKVESARVGVPFALKLLSLLGKDYSEKLTAFLGKYIAFRRLEFLGEVGASRVDLLRGPKGLGLTCRLSFDVKTLFDSGSLGVKGNAAFVAGGNRTRLESGSLALSASRLSLKGGVFLERLDARLSPRDLWVAPSFEGELGFDASGKGSVVAEGRRLPLRLKRFRGRASIKKDGVSFEGLSLSLLQGRGRLEASGALGLSKRENVLFPERLGLSVRARELSWGNYTLRELSLSPFSGGMRLKLSFSGAGLSLRTQGELRADLASKSVSFYLPELELKLPEKGGKKKGKKFDFTFLRRLRRYVEVAELKVNRLSATGLLPVEALSLKLTLGESDALVRASFDYCYLSLFADALLKGYKRVVASVSASTAYAPLDSFLACFMKKGSFYLKGALRLDSSFSFEGEDVTGLKKSLTFKAVGSVRDGVILKLSNISPYLVWILDAAKLVGISASDLNDALNFDIATFYVNGSARKVYIRSFRLHSSKVKMDLFVNGLLRLKPEVRKCLKGRVSLAGLTKKVDVCDFEGDE